MKTLDEIRKALSPMKISVVAAQTGLHPNTLYRLVSCVGTPTDDTVRRLAQWLEARK